MQTIKLKTGTFLNLKMCCQKTLGGLKSLKGEIIQIIRNKTKTTK
jgi:hypothetical protein